MASITMEAISALLDQHREALAADFRTLFSLLETKFEVQSTVEDHSQRLASVELASDDLSQRVSELENLCSSLSENNSKLTSQVTDLEGSIGSAVEGGRPTDVFSTLLCEVFGESTFASPLEIDRAHHSLAVKPAPGQRLSPIIICLHRYKIKDLLIREARWRGKLDYCGQQIRIVEDYCPEVLSQRSEHREVMTELYNRRLRPSLLYPARLRITLSGGEKKWLCLADEAPTYIDGLLLNDCVADQVFFVVVVFFDHTLTILICRPPHTCRVAWTGPHCHGYRGCLLRQQSCELLPVSALIIYLLAEPTSF